MYVNYKKYEKAKMGLVHSLIQFAELKDMYTAHHCINVMNYSVNFAEFVGCNTEEKDIIRHASVLHDIGKLAIRDEILKKNSTLTPNEFDIMKWHPYLSHEFIKNIDYFQDEADIIIHHHERVDGQGYPHNLRGDEISKLCKIVSICDAYDAITSSRPYRKALPEEYALDEIKENAGKQFDKELAVMFKDFIMESIFDKSEISVY